MEDYFRGVFSKEAMDEYFKEYNKWAETDEAYQELGYKNKEDFLEKERIRKEEEAYQQKLGEEYIIEAKISNIKNIEVEGKYQLVLDGVEYEQYKEKTEEEKIKQIETKGNIVLSSVKGEQPTIQGKIDERKVK